MLNKVSCLFSADFGLESLFKVYFFCLVFCTSVYAIHFLKIAQGKVWRCRLKTMHGGILRGFTCAEK